jgi:transposase InsO family protein
VYSKFDFAFSLKSKSADLVLNSLSSLFFLFGPPQILQCDNGKEFKNSKLIEFSKNKKIILINGKPRYPQSQGKIERFNQTLTR